MSIQSRDPNSQIAIVGAACFLPKAQSIPAFWEAVMAGNPVIKEIPRSRFDWHAHYDRDDTGGKITSRWGGFLDPVPIDPHVLGIPPKALQSVSASQLLVLEASRLALLDAGLEKIAEVPNNTCVVIGATTTADLFHDLIAIGKVEARDDEVGSQWTSHSFPGVLTNVIAGRVANRFNCTGLNLTVDAACASGLAALRVAMNEIKSGACDLAIVGAIDLDQTAYSYQGFSSVGALSTTGLCRPFDCRADGIVISEGAVVLILRRYCDAIRDGSPVYAVIESVESSSDGRGFSLTQPSSEGQLRAMRRAFETAGIAPSVMGLYEAHGTGTPLGDRTELDALISLRGMTDAGRCVVTSSKGTFGHAKAAAGLVGVLTAALALRHRKFPPLPACEEPLNVLTSGESLRVLKGGEDWPLTTSVSKRVAGVSAFGFGGVNYHAVLSEACESTYLPGVPSQEATATNSVSEWNIVDGRPKRTIEIEYDEAGRTHPQNDGHLGLGHEKEAQYCPLVITAIAAVTGYPSGTIGLDSHLTADLGIDSISRIDIVEELQRLAEPCLADVIDRAFDTLAAASTARQMAYRLLEFSTWAEEQSA